MTQLLSGRKVSEMQMSNQSTPYGATVTPVDDYVIWLRCAELPNTYGSLANVIADTTAMVTLCNNLNALRYMVRSTATIFPAVLANAGWITALDNSTYAVTTPTMTGYTTPSGVVLASTDYGVTYGQNWCWTLFDKDLATIGASVFEKIGHWVRYKFDTANIIYKYSVKGGTGGTIGSVTALDLYGSNDGTDFTFLDSMSGISDTVQVTRNIANMNEYLYYKTVATAGGGSSHIGYREIQYYCLDLY